MPSFKVRRLSSSNGSSPAGRDGILDALSWFSKEGRPRDVRVLFVAGHGERSGPRNEYYFCAYNHDSADLPDKSALLCAATKYRVAVQSACLGSLAPRYIDSRLSA